MPRVNREQTEQNRTQIVKKSVELFKSRGFTNVSVSDVMGAAGLTTGGFYGHFESKEQLTELACARAFSESATRWETIAAAATSERDFMTHLLDYYLSEKQRDDAGGGCSAAALATDVAREPTDAGSREVYVQGVKTLLGVLQQGSRSRKGRKSTEQHIGQLCTMLGAITLARATTGDEISGEVLKAARQLLLSQLEVS